MIKRLARSIREYKRASILTPLFVTMEVVMEVVIPLLMVSLIDDGIEAGNMGVILKVGAALVLSTIISLIFGALHHQPQTLSHFPVRHPLPWGGALPHRHPGPPDLRAGFPHL